MKTKPKKTIRSTLNATPATLPVFDRRALRLRKAFSLTSSSLEQTNPLRGFDLPRAVSLMEATLRGEYAIPQWTLWHIEQSDPDLIALEARRSSALMEMDWTIKIADLESRISGADQPNPKSAIENQKSLALEQANALLEAYNRFDNLNECIEDMALAFCRGFSISQFESDSSIENRKSAIENITHLGVYDPWNIVRHGLKGDFYFNPEGRSVSWQSLPAENRIDPANHLIYTPRTNLMRIAFYKFCRMNLSQKDWDAFIEIYGLPSCFIIMPPNVPAEKESQYLTLSDGAYAGGNAALPNGTDVKFANEARGVNPFRDHLRFLQEQLILAGTGGLLTMLAENTGIGKGPTDAHEDTFKTIARGEAKKIGEVFQKQFDKKILEEKFPGKPILAYFEISSREEQDIGEIITHALQLSQAGYTMDPAQLSEKTGYKIQLSAPVTSQGQGLGGDAGNRLSEKMAIQNSAPIPAGPTLENEKLVSMAVAETLGIRSEWLEPFFSALEDKARNGALTDAELLDAIEKMAKALPEIMTAGKVKDTAAVVEKMLKKSIEQEK